MNITIKSTLPLFTGYYNSIFQYNDEDQDVEHYNEQNGTAHEFEDFEWKYKEYEQKISKGCVSFVETQLKDINIPIKLEYEETTYPREYNKGTNKIFVRYHANKTILRSVLKIMKENFTALDAHLKELFTSRDGFMSFYPNDAKTWIVNLTKAISNTTGDDDFKDFDIHFGALIWFLLELEEITTLDMYEEVYFKCDGGVIEYNVNENA